MNWNWNFILIDLSSKEEVKENSRKHASFRSSVLSRLEAFADAGAFSVRCLRSECIFHEVVIKVAARKADNSKPNDSYKV